MLKTILNTAAGFLLATCIIVISSNAFGLGGSSGVERLPIEEEPMINKEAVEAYKNGDISSDDAKRRIDLRLDELVRKDAIKGWEYADGRYVVEMNNSAIFTYFFD